VIFKWALVVFALTSFGLFVLTKIIGFLNPPRPGRPEPLVLARTRRAFRWSVLLPALLGLAILAFALVGGP